MVWWILGILMFNAGLARLMGQRGHDGYGGSSVLGKISESCAYFKVGRV